MLLRVDFSLLLLLLLSLACSTQGLVLAFGSASLTRSVAGVCSLVCSSSLSRPLLLPQNNTPPRSERTARWGLALMMMQPVRRGKGHHHRQEETSSITQRIRGPGGEFLTMLSSSSSGGGGDGGAGVGGGGKGKRKQGGEKEGETDEPLLENYASRHSEPESPCLTDVREATTRTQPGGAHMVSGHLQGELLKLLTKLSGAKRVLDIGTFTGYSALAFAEALSEDGVVVTLESDARAAETARVHFDSSEHGGKIRLLLGQAMDGIDQLIREDGHPQFDIIFIDADKKRYLDYYEKVFSGPRPLLAPTGMLLADNVLFHELVPLAEAMGTSALAAPATSGASSQQQQSQNLSGTGKDEEREVNSSEIDARRKFLEKEVAPQQQQQQEERGAKKPLGGGVLAPTPRRLKIAASLDGFNKRVKEDGRVEVLMLPLRDGLSVVTWRKGGYPTAPADGKS